jgi:hypothetical protein
MVLEVKIDGPRVLLSDMNLRHEDLLSSDGEERRFIINWRARRRRGERRARRIAGKHPTMMRGV